MTAVHRPLSAWIAFVQDGSGRLGSVNDGDDRTDARTLPDFVDRWQRVGLGADRHALLLGLARAGTIAIELDDYGRPMTIGQDALTIIELAERVWPTVDERLADEAVTQLRNQPLPLRYWLAERLAAEGDPPDRLYEILPWDLFDRLVGAVTVELEHPGQPGELVEVRHWLTPAVVGLSGTLEQLDHALRSGDDSLARWAAVALLEDLPSMPIWRIPSGSRAALAELVDRVAAAYPPLRVSAAEAAAVLRSGHAALTDADIVTFFQAGLVGVVHLTILGPERLQSATIDFPRPAATVIGPDARGTVTLESGGLAVTIARFREDVPAIEVGTSAADVMTPLVRRGRVLRTVVPWTGTDLPDQLVFRVTGSPPRAPGGRP